MTDEEVDIYYAFAVYTHLFINALYLTAGSTMHRRKILLMPTT